MEISYELTEDDLLEAQVQLLVTRREALRSHPRMFVLCVACIGAIGWPLWGLLMRNSPLLSETALGGVAYLLVLWIAGAIASALKSRPVRHPRLDAWRARRMARQAARQSVFGPIT